MPAATAPKRDISRIVIHCSGTANGDALFRREGERLKSPVEVIDEWHGARAFFRPAEARQRLNPGLMSIGYHYVIYLSGAIASGRHEDEIGAHVQSFNRHSLGLCLIGTDQFSIDQWSGLTHLVADLRRRWPAAQVLGHRDFPQVAKACPGFDVAAWIDRGMVSDPAHTL